MSAGTELRARLLADFDVTDAADETKLDLICQVADDIASMEKVVAEQGWTIAGARGQHVQHPLIPAIDRRRALLFKLLQDAFGEDVTSKAQRAARTRWNRAKGATS